MEGYPDSSGKYKRHVASMEDSMLGCSIKLAKGMFAASGSKMRRAPEDRSEIKNKMGVVVD